MLPHLKIEIFAYDLFHTVWLKGGLISRKYDATQIYKAECLSDNDYMEVCDKLFYNAVLCRRILFQRIYTEEITKERDRYWNSLSDFYEYIHSMCNRYDCFGCLTVFERLFATCAFVLNLCFYNRKNEKVDIIKFGHICWAKYFNSFTEEFYEQGGWNQLKNVAHSYTSPLTFLQTCLNKPQNAFTEETETIENYNKLKQTLIIHECETVSKPWVKSQIKNLNKSSNNLFEFVGYENCMSTEHILKELKRFCNPCALEDLQYDEECSERSVFDSDSFYIPLTPTASEESMGRTDSFLVSSDGNGEDAVLASSSDDIFSECETDDSDFTNQSSLNMLEDVTSTSYCDDISNRSPDIFKQPLAFESISVISDWKQDQYLSRSMTKMHLNHDTLELEETTISETDTSNNTNDGYSGEDQVLNTTNTKIIVPQEIMDNQCQMLEDSLDVVEFVTKVLFVTEGKLSHNECLKKLEFAYVTNFFNTDLSCDNPISKSISEWDEKDLAKNASTPNKIKTLLNKE